MSSRPPHSDEFSQKGASSLHVQGGAHKRTQTHDVIQEDHQVSTHESSTRGKKERTIPEQAAGKLKKKSSTVSALYSKIRQSDACLASCSVRLLFLCLSELIEKLEKLYIMQKVAQCRPSLPTPVTPTLRQTTRAGYKYIRKYETSNVTNSQSNNQPKSQKCSESFVCVQINSHLQVRARLNKKNHGTRKLTII